MSEVLVSKLHTPATISCNGCFSSIHCSQGIIQSDGWNLLSKLSQFGDSKYMWATKIYLKGSR